MSEHDQRTMKVILPALDDDIEEMTDDEVQRELAAAGIDLKASMTSFKAFGAKALAARRRPAVRVRVARAAGTR